MGSSESTRKCPKCGVLLLESNMVEHNRECINLRASGRSDGSWECTYSGPTSGIISMSKAIAEARREAVEYKR